MNNYKSIVSSNEADALKEMIFKRARERAELIDKSIQNNYADDVKTEIMDIARNSFVANRNPFSIITKEEQNENNTNINESKNDLGFIQKQDLNLDINKEDLKVKKYIEEREVDELMRKARNEDGDKRKQFVGALGFLNSQASINALSLRKKKSFEAIA